MIVVINDIGNLNEAPIVLVCLKSKDHHWLALANKNSFGFLNICFWSTRDDSRISVENLTQEITCLVERAGKNIEAIYDIRYLQPFGWDRWLGGVPEPIRNYFDRYLHPKLKSKLEVTL